MNKIGYRKEQENAEEHTGKAEYNAKSNLDIKDRIIKKPKKETGILVKYLIDSSIWLLYFFGEDKKIKDLVEQDKVIITSTLSLFEIRKKLLKDKYGNDKIEPIIGFIKTRSLIAELSEDICTLAATNAVEHNLSAMDSLIYATARKNNAMLISADNDFRGLNYVEVY